MKIPLYFVLVLVVNNAFFTRGRVSDKRLCGDPTCSQPVSLAKTMIRYASDDARLLSFEKNIDATIYSKSAGSRPDLWGAEIKGKRGYVPKSFVREYKILKNSLQHIVDTEEFRNKISDKKKESGRITPISSSIDINKIQLTNEDPVDITGHSEVEEQERNGETSSRTPYLKPLSVQSTLADTSFPSFPGSGVSAEPYDRDSVPNPEDATQPYDVVDGTTIFLDTDGSELELTRDPIHPTIITPSAPPSAIHEHLSETIDKPSILSDSKPQSPSPDQVEKGTANVNKDKLVDDGEEEGSAGQFFQYLSSWISEGSGDGDENKETVVKETSNTDSSETKEYEKEIDKNIETGGISNKEISNSSRERDSLNETRNIAGFLASDINKGTEGQSSEIKSGSESAGKNVSPEIEFVRARKKNEKASENSQDLGAGEVKKETNNEDRWIDDEEGDDYEDEEEDEEDEEDIEDEDVEDTSAEIMTDIPNLSVDSKVNLTDDREEPKENVEEKPFETEVPNIDAHPTEEPEIKLAERMDDSKEHVSSDILLRETHEILKEEMTQISPKEDKSIPSPIQTSNLQAEQVMDSQRLNSEEQNDAEPVSKTDDFITPQVKTEGEFQLKIENPKEDHLETGSRKEPEMPIPFSVNSVDNDSNNVQDETSLKEKDNETVALADVKHDNVLKMQDHLSNNNLYSTYNEDIERESISVSPVTEKIQTGLVIENKTAFGLASEKTENKIDEVSQSLKKDASMLPIVEVPEVPEVDELYRVSESTVSKEAEIKVTQYEPTSAAPAPVVEKETSEASVEAESIKQEEGYFSFFGGLFDGSSSSAGAAEDVEDESEAHIHIEENIKKHEAEKIIEKRDSAWSTFWSGPSGDHVASSHSHSSAACKVNSDPTTAGIDSACSDVAGQEPSYIHLREGVPHQLEDTVIVKNSEDDVLEMDLQKSSYDIVLCLIITGATVLLFSLGYFYLEKKRRDGTLVAKINELEKALLVSSKECLILKDSLQGMKEKLLTVENSSVNSSEVVLSLKAELDECKAVKSELEEQVASLEKELEAATEAGLELNHMLSDFLSSQNSSETVMKSVEHLQEQLDSQQTTITSLTESLNVKTSENENLQAELNLALEKIISLEENVLKVNETVLNVQSEKSKVEEELLVNRKVFEIELEEVKSSKNEELGELRKEIASLLETVSELKDNLVTKESEVSVLQDCLKQLKSVDDGEGDDKLQALLDVGQTKAELKLMTLERDTLAEKLQGEEDARKLLEDHVRIVTEEVTKLRENYEEAEKDKVDAQTKLEVLSNYFKEKETQLQKELGLQEAMCLQKEGDATSTYERIKSLEEEIENYKSQTETLKKEILDQERGLKGQISSLEKKAHEQWIAARQAERKLEESKQEASQLRNRLTIIEKNVAYTSNNGEAQKITDRVTGDSNDELTNSPSHMGMSSLEDSPSSPQVFQHHDALTTSPLLAGPPLPPESIFGLPHPGFIPPPPPHHAPFLPPPPPLYPDRRPPPLGRMSSPPPHHYSPPPSDPRGSFSPYSDRSPPPSPPSGRYRSPPLHGNESPDRYRQHRSPPPHFNPYPNSGSRPPPHWEDSRGTSRSGFRPVPPPITRTDSPRELKGSALSSGHSSESLEKSNRHSGRV